MDRIRSKNSALANRMRRISHLKGKPVQEFGEFFEKLIRRRVSRENTKLATRINAALQKKPERLEIPFDTRIGLEWRAWRTLRMNDVFILQFHPDQKCHPDQI
jgi:hypothetical protein